MKKKAVLVFVLLMALSVYTAHISRAGYIEESKVEAAKDVLDEIMKIPEQRIPPAMLKNIYGIAIIPNVIKAGFVVGGRYGEGIIVIRTGNRQWSNPLFITLVGASVGFQIGVQASDVILVFKSRKSVDGIIQGKVTLGADASVAAGPVGRQAAAATDIELKAEIYSYSRSRGIFAGVSLDGAVLQVEKTMSAAFYGVKEINPNEVFSGSKYTAPPVADSFKQVLIKYTE